MCVCVCVCVCVSACVSVYMSEECVFACPHVNVCGSVSVCERLATSNHTCVHHENRTTLSDIKIIQFDTEIPRRCFFCTELYCSDFTMDCHNDGFVTKVDDECSCLCPPGLDPATGCGTTVRHSQ